MDCTYDGQRSCQGCKIDCQMYSEMRLAKEINEEISDLKKRVAELEANKSSQRND